MPDKKPKVSATVDFEADGIVRTLGVDEVQEDEASAFIITDNFYAEYLGGTTLATDFEVNQPIDRVNLVGQNWTTLESGLEQTQDLIRIARAIGSLDQELTGFAVVRFECQKLLIAAQCLLLAAPALQ